MENLNTTYGWIEKKQIENHLAINANTENTVRYMNEELLKVFWIKELSNENEVNSQEAELAQIFGKYEDMIELNNLKPKQPLSLASVMAKLDSVPA